MKATVADKKALNRLYGKFVQNVAIPGCDDCPHADGTTHIRDCAHPHCSPALGVIQAVATPTHYVHWNGAAVFVKEAEFFKSQGGLTAKWGEAWRAVIAEDIEDARRVGEAMHGRGEL